MCVYDADSTQIENKMFHSALLLSVLYTGYQWLSTNNLKSKV